MLTLYLKYCCNCVHVCADFVLFFFADRRDTFRVHRHISSVYRSNFVFLNDCILTQSRYASRMIAFSTCTHAPLFPNLSPSLARSLRQYCFKWIKQKSKEAKNLINSWAEFGLFLLIYHSKHWIINLPSFCSGNNLAWSVISATANENQVSATKTATWNWIICINANFMGSLISPLDRTGRYQLR